MTMPLLKLLLIIALILFVTVTIILLSWPFIAWLASLRA